MPAGDADALDPVHGWGDVPVDDRHLWSRYMVDHPPWFPGATIMNYVAVGVINGGTKAPLVWKQTAQDLHADGFTPMSYYLLAELLKSASFRDAFAEELHSHLFEIWQPAEKRPTVFRLAAEEWKPWLLRVQNGESPRRALEHMLKGRRSAPAGDDHQCRNS